MCVCHREYLLTKVLNISSLVNALRGKVHYVAIKSVLFFIK